ncbi:MAG: class I SAM-dependent methyltransferase [Bacteroidales bacterium]
MNEIRNIEDRYKKRSENPKKENFYFQYFAKSERELIYSEIVNKYWKSNFRSCKILEIGAGGGDNLLFFHRLGIPWQNIFANELLMERVCLLRENLKSSTIISGDALDLDYDHYFDIVFQSTVFTSILDNNFKRELALKMMKMVKENGIILWYDFKYNNPYNPDVKGVNKKEIRELFKEANEIVFHNVTLAPPIGRRINKWYNLFNFLFPFFRTHLITVVKLS